MKNIKFKGYKCSCGNDTFYISGNLPRVALMCHKCSKWQKWLSKDEVNQFNHNASEQIENNINMKHYNELVDMKEKLCNLENSLSTKFNDSIRLLSIVNEKDKCELYNEMSIICAKLSVLKEVL